MSADERSREEPTSTLKLGYIGLGNQGAPMAKRLVDWPGGLIVFDVRAESMTPLAELGATLADSVADVAAADVISVTVLTDAQVRDVVRELGRSRQAGYRHCDSLDDRARVRPVSLPTSCSPREFTSSMLRSVVVPALRTRVSWPSWSALTTRPTTRSSRSSSKWASMVVRAGEPGAGTRMKLARNMLTFIGFAAACEAQKLAEAAGIDLQKLGRVVRHSDAQSGGPGAIMVRDDTKPLEPDNFLYDMFVHTRGLADKDLRLALSLGEATGVDLPLAEIALRDLAAGLGVPQTTSTTKG